MFEPSVSLSFDFGALNRESPGTAISYVRYFDKEDVRLSVFLKKHHGFIILILIQYYAKMRVHILHVYMYTNNLL